MGHPAAARFGQPLRCAGRPDGDEPGASYCHLFVSQNWIDGRVPHEHIPERRPPEKILGVA